MRRALRTNNFRPCLCMTYGRPANHDKTGRGRNAGKDTLVTDPCHSIFPGWWCCQDGVVLYVLRGVWTYFTHFRFPLLPPNAPNTPPGVLRWFLEDGVHPVATSYHVVAPGTPTATAIVIQCSTSTPLVLWPRFVNTNGTASWIDPVSV